METSKKKQALNKPRTSKPRTSKARTNKARTNKPQPSETRALTRQQQLRPEPNVGPIATEPTLGLGLRFSEAYRASAEAREALEPAELLHLTFDATLAVNIALAAVPRLVELKEEIAKLPVDHELIDQLDTYAHAVGYAQALYSVAIVSQELQAVYADALARRVTLRSDVVNLATHGLVNQDAVLAIKGDVGYRNVGYELLSLVSILREAEPRVAGRAATLPNDLDRAEQVATQLLELTAIKEQRQQGDPRAAEDRLRAISLMVKAYEQARRAVHFLRWDYGDADKFTPSIYTARAAKRRNAPGEEEPQVPTVPTLPGASPATASSEVAGEPAVPHVPGAPGGNPFIM